MIDVKSVGMFTNSQSLHTSDGSSTCTSFLTRNKTGRWNVEFKVVLSFVTELGCRLPSSFTQMSSIVFYISQSLLFGTSESKRILPVLSSVITVRRTVLCVGIEGVRVCGNCDRR